MKKSKSQRKRKTNDGKKTRFTAFIMPRRDQWKTLAACHRYRYHRLCCSRIFGHFPRVRQEQNAATMRDGTQIKPPPLPVVGALRFPWQFAGIYKSTDTIRRPVALFPRSSTFIVQRHHHHPRQSRARSPTPCVLIK